MRIQSIAFGDGDPAAGGGPEPRAGRWPTGRGGAARAALNAVGVLLVFATGAAAAEQSVAAQLMVSPRPIVSVALSPTCAHLCLVQLAEGEYVLRIKAVRGAEPAQEVFRDRYIRSVRFVDEDRVVYVAAKGGIRVHNRRTGRSTALGRGRRPVCRGDQLAYLHTGRLRIRNLHTGRDRTLPVGPGFAPCTWMDDACLLACRDGSVWRLPLEGEPACIVEGSTYAPWFVDAALSPDGQTVLLTSDDTKADVGAGARSLWLVPAAGGSARKLMLAASGQWLGRDRVGLALRNELVTVETQTGSTTVIHRAAGMIEAFACRNSVFVFAVKHTDGDGLYRESTLHVIVPPGGPDAGVDGAPRHDPGTGPAAKRSCTAHEVTLPPTLDGVLDEPCWEGAPVISDFQVYQTSGRIADVRTTARFCFNRDTLFVGVVCDEPNMGGLKAECTERDGHVWGDDCVEIWLDVNLDQCSSFHFLVNPLGVVQDIREWYTPVAPPRALDPGAKRFVRHSDPKWNAQVRTAARRSDHSWTIEAAFPAAELGVRQISRGSVWGLNVARTRRCGGTEELSSSSGVFTSPLSRFGMLQLGRSDLEFDVVSWGNRACGRNCVVLTVSNRARRPQAVTLELLAVSRTTDRHQTEIVFDPGASRRVALPYVFRGAAAPYQLSLTVRERASGKSILSRQLQGVVPAMLGVSVPDSELFLGEQKHVKGTVSVNVGDLDQPACALSLSLVDAKGTGFWHQRLAPIRGHTSAITVNIEVLKSEGDYRLRAELHDAHGRALAEAWAPVNLIEPPF